MESEHELLQLELKGVKDLMNQDNYQEAEERLVKLMPRALQLNNNDDLAPGMAEFYYQYGSVLVAKIQANSDVFGEVILKAEQNTEQSTKQNRLVGQAKDQEVPAQEKEEQNEQEEQSQSQDQQVEGEQGGQQQQQREQNNLEKTIKEQYISSLEEDVKIAWENLETAKHILEIELEKIADQQFTNSNDLQKNLAKVYIRKGELENWRDNFSIAIEDFKRCLEIRKKVESNELSRDLAEIYFQLGNTHIYRMEDGDEEQATIFFKQAAQILENNLAEKIFMQKKIVEEVIQEQEYNLFHLKENMLDNEDSKTLKSILQLLYEKIYDLKLSKQEGSKGIRQEFQKITQEEKQLNEGFGKQQLEQTNVINLGTFGKAIKRQINNNENSNEDKKENQNTNEEEIEKNIKYD